MTVTACIEQDLNGDRTYRVALNEGETCRRTFKVQTSDPTDNEPTIYQQAQSVGPNPLPQPLDLFPGSTTSYAHAYDVIRTEEDRLIWVITVDYKTVLNFHEINRANEPIPINRKTLISGVARTLMIPVRSCLRTTNAYNTWDASSAFTMQVAANSATDPLDPPIEIATTEWELHCEKNVSYIPSWFLKYGNGVNSANQDLYLNGSKFTIPSGCGKLSNLVFSELKQENAVNFITLAWNVTVRVPRQIFSGESVPPSPWDVERLDEGMRTLKGAGSTKTWTNIPDSTGGTTITSPVPFNGSGVPITATGTSIPFSSLKFYCYRPNGPQVDYSVIPWPLS